MKLRETFEGYLEYMRQTDYNQKTIGAHRHFLYGPVMQALGDAEVEELKLNDQAKVLEAGRPYGDYGSQRAITTFRALMEYLDGDGHVLKFDWRNIKTPQSPARKNEYFTETELETVMSVIDLRTIAGLRTRALLEVLYATGMRISEACALDQSSINWEEKTATILNAKFQAYQPIYFTDRSLEWLKKYLDARKDKDIPALFTSGRGRLLPQSSRTFLRDHMKPALKALGLEKHLKHHAFRKTFVTHLFEKGGDIVSIRAAARHNSPRTTLRYYAVANQERVKAMHQRLLNGTGNGAEKSVGTGVATSTAHITVAQPGDIESMLR